MCNGWICAGLIALVTTASALAEDLPLRDPMQPYRRVPAADAAEAVARGFALSAVLISDSRRIAVINGDLRREGDEIDGARLIRIEPFSVRLRRGGEELVVPLNGSRTGAQRQ